MFSYFYLGHESVCMGLWYLFNVDCKPFCNIVYFLFFCWSMVGQRMWWLRVIFWQFLPIFEFVLICAASVFLCCVCVFWLFCMSLLVTRVSSTVAKRVVVTYSNKFKNYNLFFHVHKIVSSLIFSFFVSFFNYSCLVLSFRLFLFPIVFSLFRALPTPVVLFLCFCFFNSQQLIPNWYIIILWFLALQFCNAISIFIFVFTLIFHMSWSFSMYPCTPVVSAVSCSCSF